MTKKQMKLCKSIRKYENLDLIMKKKGFTHYSQIYDELGTDCFHCSDWNIVFVKRKCEQKGPQKVSTFSTRFHVVSNAFPKYQMLTF